MQADRRFRHAVGRSGQEGWSWRGLLFNAIFDRAWSVLMNAASDWRRFLCIFCSFYEPGHALLLAEFEELVFVQTFLYFQYSSLFGVLGVILAS